MFRQTVVFHGIAIEIFDEDGHTWISRQAIAHALGYRGWANSLSRFHKRLIAETKGWFRRKSLGFPESGPLFRQDIKGNALYYNVHAAIKLADLSSQVVSTEFATWLDGSVWGPGVERRTRELLGIKPSVEEPLFVSLERRVKRLEDMLNV